MALLRRCDGLRRCEGWGRCDGVERCEGWVVRVCLWGEGFFWWGWRRKPWRRVDEQRERGMMRKVKEE